MTGALVSPPASLFDPMTDPFGRTISYLRVSVTDRCDLRCFYCMSEDMTFLPKADLLTLEELDRLCSAFIAKGVRKLRLHGPPGKEARHHWRAVSTGLGARRRGIRRYSRGRYGPLFNSACESASVFGGVTLSGSMRTIR